MHEVIESIKKAVNSFYTASGGEIKLMPHQQKALDEIRDNAFMKYYKGDFVSNPVLIINKNDFVKIEGNVVRFDDKVAWIEVNGHLLPVDRSDLKMIQRATVKVKVEVAVNVYSDGHYTAHEKKSAADACINKLNGFVEQIYFTKDVVVQG